MRKQRILPVVMMLMLLLVISSCTKQSSGRFSSPDEALASAIQTLNSQDSFRLTGSLIIHDKTAQGTTMTTEETLDGIFAKLDQALDSFMKVDIHFDFGDLKILGYSKEDVLYVKQEGDFVLTLNASPQAGVWQIANNSLVPFSTFNFVNYLDIAQAKSAYVQDDAQGNSVIRMVAPIQAFGVAFDWSSQAELFQKMDVTIVIDSENRFKNASLLCSHKAGDLSLHIEWTDYNNVTFVPPDIATTQED